MEPGGRVKNGENTNIMKEKCRKHLLVKLRSERGISMIFALLLMLLCSVLGILILGLAKLQVSRSEIDYQHEQQRLAAVSAVNVVTGQLAICSDVWDMNMLDTAEMVVDGVQLPEHELTETGIVLLETMEVFAAEQGKEEQQLTFYLNVSKETVCDEQGEVIPEEEIPVIPEVRIKISLKPDPDLETEYLDEKKTILELPVVLDGIAAGRRSSEFVTELLFGAEGMLIYDSETRLLEVALGRLVIREP